MRTTHKFISVTLFCTLASLGLATVNINIGAETLCDKTGIALDQKALVLLVASTADTNFSPIIAGTGSLAKDSLLNGTDDVVLWRGDLTSGDIGTLFDSATVNFTESGNPIALYWFPTLTTSSLNTTNGVSYGFFTDAVGHDASDPWLMPSDSNSINLNFITADASIIGSSGSFPDSAGWASLTVTAIPEPSTYAAIFGALTLGGVCYRRYRRK